MQCVYKKNVNLNDLYLRNPYCSKYKYFTAKDTDGRSTVYHDKGIDGRSTVYHDKGIDGRSTVYHDKGIDGRSTVYHDKGIDVQGRSTKTSNICEFIACTIICTWLIKSIEPDVNGITTD